MPAIAYWKNKIPPKEVDQIIMSMDIFPTIVDLVDNTSQPDINFDGESFLALLKDTCAVVQKRALFWRFGNNKKAVRLNDWKYIKYNQGEYLFNLADDLKEPNNLIDSFPDVVDNLNSSLIKWEKDMSKYKYFTN